jgi:hypothetical protein
VANGGTGQTSYTDGQLLIGNSTGNTLAKATLTAGSGITITNGAGSVTIAATGSGGTVTSVGGTGTVNGITLTGTVTSSGNLTLGGTLSGVSLTTQVSGTLPVANGGTGQTSYTDGQLLIGNSTGNTLAKATLTAGSGIAITNGPGSVTITSLAAGGTVTSVDVSGGTTGLTTSGGPITSSGTITLAGTLGVANGGTGVTTSTGTGSVVLSNSPTLVTPTLGAASATSITNALGTVGAPSYTFTGDTNTGMWSPAADTIAFSTAGSERLQVNSSGNVGIGTSSPGAKLQINVQDGFRFDVEAGAASTMRLGSAFTGESTGALAWVRSAGSMTFSSGTTGSALTEHMRILNGGNVGIGTTSPAARLDLNGNTAQNIVAVAALDVNCTLGNFFTKTIAANSTFTFSNPPASRAYAFTLEIVHTSGTITWPTTVRWPGNTAPTLTTGRTHLITFVTDNGGTIWFGAPQTNYLV